jgi:thiopurine S-methyltransferase
MENHYWQGRWARGETGWHQKIVESALVAQFSSLKPTRVLVPLCGKSMDMTWLASRGHEVIGVELSEIACEAYFEENKIPFQKRPSGAQGSEFTVYQGGNVTLFNGNFFNLKATQLGTIGAVYDRAALIALPPNLRVQYAAKVTQLIHHCGPQGGTPGTEGSFRFLQVVLERTPPDTQGPPFSVSNQELEAHYGRYFEITLLHREAVDMGDSSAARTEECVYDLKILRP